MTQADNKISVLGSSQDDRSISRQSAFLPYENEATELVEQNSGSGSLNFSRLFKDSLSAENFVPVKKTT